MQGNISSHKSLPNLSDEERTELMQIYQRRKNVLPNIIKMGGDIGKLAELCIHVGLNAGVSS